MNADLRSLPIIVLLLALSGCSYQAEKDAITAFEDLGGMASRESVSLQSTNVADAGLEHLKGLTKLISLDLGGTQVSDEGVKNLTEALPQCKISH
jgi:hypothetical protein